MLLESCIQLGGTLLEQWTPDGEERDSKSEREFKKDMEDFYETAKCTRFDDDIQVIMKFSNLFSNLYKAIINPYVNEINLSHSGNYTYE